MSNKHIDWAFKQDIDKPGAKLVLVALANLANKELGTCFPGQKYLARQTSQGERTVRRHLDELERDGFISRAGRRRKDGSRTSDLITLNTETDTHTSQLAEAEPPAKCTVPTGQLMQVSQAKLAGLNTEVDPALYTSAFKEDSLQEELGGWEGRPNFTGICDAALDERFRVAEEDFGLTQSDRDLIQKFGSGELWERATAIEFDRPGAGTDWLLAAVREAAGLTTHGEDLD